MTDGDPSSQPTPTRRDEWGGDDGHATHYAPRAPHTPPPVDAGDPGDPDAQSTHYAPRSGAPLADAHTSSTPFVSAPARDVPRSGSGGSWAPSNWHLPEDRFAAPPPEVVRTRRAPSAVKVLSWSLAVVLLAVAAGFVYVRFIRKPPIDEAVKVPQSSSSKSQAVVLRGDEVVRGYLTALSQGDVAKALTFGPTGGNGSQSLLSEAAYGNSLKVAPITDVNVPTADANATEIPASYTLGDQQVKTSFRVVKQDNGSWLMSRTTTTFRIQGTNVDSVPLKVNGVTLAWETPVELVPGTYTMTTGLPFIAFDAKDRLTVINLNYSDVTTHNTAPALTPQGQAALIEAGRRSLTACASRKEPAPQNCPQNLPSDAPLDPKTIVWKVVSDPFSGARPGLRATDQSRAELNIVVRLTLSAKIKNQERWLNATQYSIPANISADMTVSTAELVRPEWRS